MKRGGNGKGFKLVIEV